jgi:hypothetical protein
MLAEVRESMIKKGLIDISYRLEGINMRTLFLLLVLFATPTFARMSPIEEGWKSIKVFKANRNIVEKILAVPSEKIISTETSYRTKDEIFHFVYSASPCSNKGDGRFNVSKDTVIKYEIFFRNGIPLSELKWNKKLYKRSQSSDQLGVFYYGNTSKGVLLETRFQDDVEKVFVVHFDGSAKEASRLTCKQYK